MPARSGKLPDGAETLGWERRWICNGRWWCYRDTDSDLHAEIVSSGFNEYHVHVWRGEYLGLMQTIDDAYLQWVLTHPTEFLMELMI